MQVTVLAVGGTGESHPGDRRIEVSGLLREVTDALDDRFVSRWVSYPASYGPVAAGGLSYRQSTEVGVRRVIDAIDAADGPVMLIGYSQGCTVVREVLGRITLDRRAKLCAAGLISDPEQPQGAVPDCHGRGVAGVGAPVPDSMPILWVGHPQDVICNASDDSYVRDIADLTRSMSFRNLRMWLAGIWELLRSNSFQNATKTHPSPGQWLTDLRRLRTALIEILGYLPAHLQWRGLRVVNPRGGRHIGYATEPFDRSGLTGCQILAQWLQVQATFGHQRAADPLPRVA